MLNRLAILLFLTFSSVAIPMQNKINYQTRTIQNLDLESCVDHKDKTKLADDILNKTPENYYFNKPNCKN